MKNFTKVIDRAKLACGNSGIKITEHFLEVRKTIQMPKNAKKIVTDYELSRYACYLIVQNGDPRKEVNANECYEFCSNDKGKTRELIK